MNRRTVVVCTWLVTFPVAAVRSVGGVVPFAPMARILDIIALLQSPDSEENRDRG